MEDSRAFEALARAAATSREPGLVAACLTALGRMKDGRAVPILAGNLAPGRAKDVRSAAVAALGLLGLPPGVTALRPIAASAQDPLRLAARQAIARIEFVSGKSL